MACVTVLLAIACSRDPVRTEHVSVSPGAGGTTSISCAPANGGSYSTGGTSPLAQNGVEGIAVDATGVFWTGWGAGTVMKSTPNGKRTVLASDRILPDAIAVDSQSVYWAEESAVMKVPRDGGAVTTLASGRRVIGIALDGDDVYYTTCEGLYRALMKVPADGGAPQLVASREQNGGLADGANVYWVAQAALLKAPLSMALDQFTAYWRGPTVMDATNFYFNGGSDIGQVPKSGGALITLASSQFSVGSIAVDGASVYWSTETTIMKTPIGGGVESTLASGQVGGPFAIAVDATNVYWGAHGGIWSKAPIDSGTPASWTVVISGESKIGALAVDSTNLYWTSDAVKKMPLGGGPATLVPGVNQYGPHGPLAVNGTDVAWVDQSSALIDHRLGASGRTLATHAFGGDVIALDAMNAYYIDDTGYPSAIMKVPLGGGLPTAVVSGSIQRSALAVDATSVYWTGSEAADAGLFGLMKTPLGGGPDVLLDPLASGFGALALDDTNLYWTSSDSVVMTPRAGGAVTTLSSGENGPTALTSDGTDVYFVVRDGVRRVSVNGGAPTTIAAGMGVQAVIAVDAKSVYWATFDGTIMKAPK